MGLLDRRHKLIALTFGLVFVFGLIINLRGQVGPLIQEDYQLSYGQFGFALSFLSLGGVLFNLLGGLLIERFGLKKILLSGLLTVIAGTSILNYINTYLLLILVMILLGIGITLINLTATSLISVLSQQSKGKMMNYFHFFFGLGGVLAPIYADFIMNLNFTWERTYFFTGIISLVLLVISLKSSFPIKKKPAKKSLEMASTLIKDSRVILFFIIFLFYCGAELGAGSWLSLYLNDVQNRSQEEIRFYLSLFFICFTFGRLLAGKLVEKLGYVLWIILSTGSAILLILAAIVGPESWAILFSISGLAFAGIFPTLQAIMFEEFEKEVIPTVLGITLTAASIGFMVFGDWGIGYFNNLVGIEIGYGIIVIYLLFFLLTFLFYLKSSSTIKSN